MTLMTNDEKTLILIAPRGFCAGVDRAIKIVEQALIRHGKPVYVRHEIVHNQRVVEKLEEQGAIFVDEIDEVPPNMPVIFSAHGVPKAIPEAAQARGLTYLDATCPLVSKVHIEATRHAEANRHILLIGHAGHPEVEGTMGQVQETEISLIETVEDAASFTPPAGLELAYVTQTTLSVDDTAEIVSILCKRFPNIAPPHKEDICYATTNRQSAVKSLAPSLDLLLVIGAENSSNSLRLVEVGARAGAENAYLIHDASAINWEWTKNAQRIGITAGASAPEEIVQEVINAFKARFVVSLDEYVDTIEQVHFNLPRELRD